MMTFIIENLGTIFVGLIVTVIVALILIKLVRDRRKGKSLGCDCGGGECGECPYTSGCKTK